MRGRWYGEWEKCYDKQIQHHINLFLLTKRKKRDGTREKTNENL